MKSKSTLESIIFLLLFSFSLYAEDGYKLWLDYKKAPEPVLTQYRQQIKNLMVIKGSSTLDIAENELFKGVTGILEGHISAVQNVEEGTVLAGKFTDLQNVIENDFSDKIKLAGEEGFVISSEQSDGKNITVISANSDVGILYGVFHFLQLLQTGKDISNLDIVSSPKVKIRVLNHWDNLDGSIERGYAGNSLWDWESLPGKTDPRYTDYARANASIGINGSVLNNVNANPAMLTPEYLEKVKVLADIFRPYGIKVFLSIKFSSPVNIGGLETADPLEPTVQEWWKNKVREVYSYIPDFGGFLVKANSEGQPGPQNYGRTHAEGANMLADALKPFGGIVMWRAFVYDNNVPEDRAKQALNEFKPLDGQFRDNVLIQVKNGPIDFQPREPFHPIFGNLPKTPVMMEFQITQEYLGQSTDLCYLAPMYKEVLDADTYAKGKGSTVAKVIDGTLEGHELTGMAGVANTGSDRNWTGHLFGQSNWFAFGRLAWNDQLSSEEIADEWIKMTFSSDPKVVTTIKKIMMDSRENSVNYMTPLGLHHIMGMSHHFGPGPWVSRGRADWTSLYYHRADSFGIGFDRTPTGSNATGQYFKPVADKFANLKTCPDEYLLWFHHLPWNYKMRSGKTLWDELCLHYYAGVEGVKKMQAEWNSLHGRIDPEEFEFVKNRIEAQVKLAEWWRNSCVLYFQQFSKMPIPEELEKPTESLQYYQKLNYRDFEAK
ncbi:MAG: alpha-glucuronidase [Prolixibacteraceae bacterium]|nr:alpha-glucuronidase [Prolixibacteraceae bacterium]